MKYKDQVYDINIIPEGVIDVAAYKEACKIATEFLRPELIQIEASDGTVATLGGGVYFLKNKIAHLPEKEYLKILKKNSEVMGYHKKVMALMNKARGYAPARKEIETPQVVYETHRAEIIELMGRLYSPQEIQTILMNKYNVLVKTEWLQAFQTRNHDAVNELKESYVRDISNVRLGHKRARLEEMLAIYNNRKWKYVQRDTVENENQLLKILSLIRQETEDNTLTINSNIIAQVELSISNHEKNLLINEAILLRIIITRLASKYNLNPMFYLSKLENGIYSQFYGVNKEIMDYNAQPIWPSQMMQGLDTVEEKAKQVEGIDENIRITIPEKITFTRNNTEIKEALLEKIRNKQNELKKIQVDSYLSTQTENEL